MHFRLRVLNTELKDTLFELDRGSVSIGRSGENDIVLEQASVSRSHAVLAAENGEVVVRDLGSRNRTKVDGETVEGSRPIRSGTVVSIGDVLLSVDYAREKSELGRARDDLPATLGYADMAPSDEEETPVGGVPAPPETSPGRAGTMRPATGIPEAWLAAEPPEDIAPEKVRSIKLKGWAVLFLVIGGAVSLVAYFLHRGGEQPPVARMVQQLRIGQKRVTQVPYGFVYGPQAQPRGIVDISREKGMSLFVIVEGKSTGTATVKLYNQDRSRYCVLYVQVFPREIDETDELAWNPELTPQRRQEMARKLLTQADAIRRNSLYEAMQMYRRASQLMRDMEGHRLFTEAIEKYYDAEDEINERYRELLAEMAINIDSGNRRGALKKLAQIKALIPDEEDWRRQDADLRYRLLRRIIARRERREKFLQ